MTRTLPKHVVIRYSFVHHIDRPGKDVNENVCRNPQSCHDIIAITQNQHIALVRLILSLYLDGLRIAEVEIVAEVLRVLGCQPFKVPIRSDLARGLYQ